MSTTSQMDIYVGKDPSDPGKLLLYTSDTATYPLPSHLFELTYAATCLLTFRVRSGDPDVEFIESAPLTWNDPPNPEPAANVVNAKEIYLVHCNTNSAAADQAYSFNLHLNVGSTAQAITISRETIGIDPTIVDKGDQGTPPSGGVGGSH